MHPQWLANNMLSLLLDSKLKLDLKVSTLFGKNNLIQDTFFCRNA